VVLAGEPTENRCTFDLVPCDRVGPKSSYEIGLRSLSRDAFVADVTSSGKSTTIFSLLSVRI
jgi:hypothetical protein